MPAAIDWTERVSLLTDFIKLNGRSPAEQVKKEAELHGWFKYLRKKPDVHQGFTHFWEKGRHNQNKSVTHSPKKRNHDTEYKFHELLEWCDQHERRPSFGAKDKLEKRLGALFTNFVSTGSNSYNEEYAKELSQYYTSRKGTQSSDKKTRHKKGVGVKEDLSKPVNKFDEYDIAIWMAKNQDKAKKILDKVKSI